MKVTIEDAGGVRVQFEDATIEETEILNRMLVEHFSKRHQQALSELDKKYTPGSTTEPALKPLVPAVRAALPSVQPLPQYVIGDHSGLVMDPYMPPISDPFFARGCSIPAPAPTMRDAPNPAVTYTANPA